MADVSVIVCTRNGAGRLRSHLATVAAAARAEGAELIVVDNGSSDDSAIAAAEVAPGVRIVTAQEPGLARARNAGVAAARGRAILFTDDDVDVPVNWVTRMSAPLLDGTADVVAGGIRVADDLRAEWMSPWLLGQFADHPEPSEDDAFVVGASFGATAAVLGAMPFDEQLGAAPYQREEDAFFWVQARERGLRIRGVRGAPAEHHFERDRLETPALLALAGTMGRCRAWVWHHWLHGDAPRLALKELAYRFDLAVRPVPRGDHPADDELRRIARLEFIRELRRLRGVERRYPSPDVRAAARVPAPR